MAAQISVCSIDPGALRSSDRDFKIEIGGMNGIRPLVVGVDYNVPTIDGDYMGRAYPRLYIMTPACMFSTDMARGQKLTSM